jgi:hypothetical protein
MMTHGWFHPSGRWGQPCVLIWAEASKEFAFGNLNIEEPHVRSRF